MYPNDFVHWLTKYPNDFVQLFPKGSSCSINYTGGVIKTADLQC